MDVLVVSEVFPPRPGGSGRWLWEIYRRLTDLSVTVAAGETPGAEPFDQASPLCIRRVSLDFRTWGMLSVGGAAGYVRAFVGLLRMSAGERPRAIHCGKCLPEGLLGLALARSFRVPMICFTHGEELALAHTSGELRFLTERVLRGADRVIANSEHTRKMLMSEWRTDGQRVHVLHPGVDSHRFVPAAPDPAVRERLGWTRRRVVLTVGALQKRKGQDMLLRAVPAIRRTFPNILYAIAGEGWERAYLEHLVHELQLEEWVQFLGVPDDRKLVQLYQQCDLFAMPNRQVGWDFEGFGIAFLEAQSCGRGVIAGASGGAPETLTPHVTGELVQGDDPEAVANAVIELLGDPDRLARIGRAARDWVTDRFDWEALMPRTREALGLNAGSPPGWQPSRLESAG